MGLRMLAGLAWKNLWRQKRRTGITLSSIAFSCVLAVFIIGLNDQSWEDVINTAARIGGGHITLLHPDYMDKPALSRTVRGVQAKAQAIRRLAHVTRVLPRVVGQLMLSSTSESFGAGFIAYDPSMEDEQSLSILQAVQQGQLFVSAKDKGIILGHRLARNLGVELGSKVVYTLTDKHGEIVSGLARVSGIVKTGSPAVDLGLCFLPLDALRKTLGYTDDESVQIAVFVDSQRRAAEVQNEIMALLQDGTVALTWKQTQPDLAGFIAMKKGGGVFFSILMLVLCAAGIFNTLFVSVMERLREFGILIALGLSPRTLFVLVMLESLLLGLVGLLISTILVAWPYHHLSTVGMDMSQAYAAQGGRADIAGVGMSMVLKIGLYPGSAVAIVCAVLAAVLLSGLYPAYKASRVQPVAAMGLA